ADKILLFATKTCPNCKVAKSYLDKAGVPYTTVYADEDTATTEKYEVRQAPTLVLVQGDNAEKIVNLSNIKKFTEEYAK
ncbi:MAG: glutaredoxin family protein, partial [Clostridia bacterium]|nr:glutaredoxin family protein [Clostridia bacterium]